jgi:alkaline phosphatase D
MCVIIHRGGQLPMRFISVLITAALAAGAAAAAEPLRRIGFGSCASQEKPQPVWEAVLAAKPDLFLLLGDNIYSDTDNLEIMKAKYAKFAEVPGYQKLKAACPLMAMWDDHDYGSNDAGADNPAKEGARRLFLEFFGEPADSPRWKQPGVYAARVFGPEGKRVQVILLDTRFNRSPLKKAGRAYVPDPDPANTMLGEQQWKWLEEQLRQPAEIRLLGTSIQLVPDEHIFEKWGNFPHERARLIKLIADTGAAGVIVLSGDRHLAELSVLTDSPIGYPLFDLTSSGLNMGNKRWRAPEKNAHRVATMTSGDNFGMILIDWDAEDPQIRLQIRDVDGEVTIQQKVLLSQLRRNDRAVARANPAVPLAPGAISPADAAKRVGDQVTIQFAVKGTGAARDKSRVFLNSGDFRDKDNFTVVLDMKKLEDGLKAAGIADPREFYKGKTVRVTGTVSMFRDSPQIVVDDMKQIVVEGK